MDLDALFIVVCSALVGAIFIGYPIGLIAKGCRSQRKNKRKNSDAFIGTLPKVGPDPKAKIIDESKNILDAEILEVKNA